MNGRWVYYFGDGSAEGDGDRKDLLGGKGASLAAMCRAKLPVPPGFTISTECCPLYLASGQWPAGLREQVSENLARLERSTGRRFGDPHKPLLVSVRSGAAVSMPGMMDTILNVGLSPEMIAAAGDSPPAWGVYAGFVLMFGKTVAGISPERFEAAAAEGGGQAGPSPKRLAQAYLALYEASTGRKFPTDPRAALTECIETVFRSWNTQRAQTYRREHDIRDCHGTAVNVQAMFPSEVSGIVFTANPNDLSAGEMIVEASWGLGEAVVSGDVHPDNFVLDRESLAVRRRTIGHKVHMVAALGDATAHDPAAACLSDEQLAELGRMSLDVETFFGKPMDIEFGRADGKFGLLQARPIRGLDVLEDVEVGRQEEVHRLRGLLDGLDRKVWVLHNLDETLISPTPLTWDIIRRFMSGDGGFGRMYKDLGYQPSPRVCREGFLELICGRIYADPDRAAELLYGDVYPRKYDLDALAGDPRLIEDEPRTFDPVKAGPKFLAALPRLVWSLLKTGRAVKRLRATAKARFEQDILPAYLQWVAAAKARDLSALSTAALLAELESRVDRVMDQFGGESLKPGFMGGAAQAALKNRLGQLMGEQRGNELALQLTQGLEGDETIEQNIALWKLANGHLTRQEFLDRYGHRAVGEMELAKPRFREDDSYIRQVLPVYMDPNVVSPAAKHEENVARRKEAQRDLTGTLAGWGGSSFREQVLADLDDAQALLPYRETGKHYLMMGYETIRDVLTELAGRWGLGRDLFFLRYDELKDFEGRREELTARIGPRKVRWQSARRLEMAAIVDSRDLENLGVPRRYDASDELAGQAVAPGVGTGRARIVFDPTQQSDVCTDYVLVCPSTDPSWTALFVHARGLIVEKGGVLSHGAIVARDFGIPAVVCPDATRRIPAGAMVRVDGGAGRITILSAETAKV